MRSIIEERKQGLETDLSILKKQPFPFFLEKIVIRLQFNNFCQKLQQEMPQFHQELEKIFPTTQEEKQALDLGLKTPSKKIQDLRLQIITPILEKMGKNHPALFTFLIQDFPAVQNLLIKKDQRPKMNNQFTANQIMDDMIRENMNFPFIKELEKELDLWDPSMEPQSMTERFPLLAKVPWQLLQSFTRKKGVDLEENFGILSSSVQKEIERAKNKIAILQDEKFAQFQKDNANLLAKFSLSDKRSLREIRQSLPKIPTYFKSISLIKEDLLVSSSKSPQGQQLRYITKDFSNETTCAELCEKLQKEPSGFLQDLLTQLRTKAANMPYKEAINQVLTEWKPDSDLEHLHSLIQSFKDTDLENLSTILKDNSSQNEFSQALQKDSRLDFLATIPRSILSDIIEESCDMQELGFKLMTYKDRSDKQMLKEILYYVMRKQLTEHQISQYLILKGLLTG
jgi:hypothetical protein